LVLILSKYLDWSTRDFWFDVERVRNPLIDRTVAFG
jgi:hypothetical protein